MWVQGLKHSGQVFFATFLGPLAGSWVGGEVGGIRTHAYMGCQH